MNNAGSGTNVLTFGTDSDADSSVVIADNDGTGGVVSVVKNGAGTEILRGASTYSGGTVLNAGTLHARSQNDAFGTGPITLNGGTIINHQSTIANPLNVVTDSYLTADGNCTFAGPITGTNTLHVFYDNETFSWGGAADIMAGFGGTLDFAGCGPGGNMRFYGSTGGDQVTFLMDSTNSITLNSRNSGTIHLGELIGNSNAIVAGATDSGNVSMYVIGGKNTSSTFAGTFGNPGGGGNPVGLTKIGTGTFTLAGVNTYEGPTVVSNGVFAVTAEGGLTNSSVITVVAPGKLDTAGFGGTLALGAWTVAQTLGGNGTIMGNVTADVMSPVTIAPGAPVGTLSISGSLTMNNNTTAVIALNRTNAAANCGSIAATSITAGGTLNVTNAGPDLVAGDTFKLFSTAVTGFDTVNLPQANADGSVTYTWTNNLAEDGTVTVLTGASPVNTNPTNLEVTVSGNQLSLSWPADHTGWRLQVQTNDLSTGISTNWYDVSGSETINQTNVTINSDNGSVFYRLVY